MAAYQPPPGISLDVGNLVAFDERAQKNANPTEETIREVAESLVHAIFTLPLTDDVDGRYVTLPNGAFELPREKPIPRERQTTKWEKYAREKGIQKDKKRDRLVLDDATGEYVPRYGRGSKNAIDRDIILPHKESMGDDYNPFTEKRKEKKKRVVTNHKKQTANIERSRKSTIHPMQALNVAKAGPSGKKYLPKSALKDSLSVVQRSTASAGRFDKRVKNEPKQKLRGRKKKHATVGGRKGLQQEQLRSGKIADRILKS